MGELITVSLRLYLCQGVPCVQFSIFSIPEGAYTLKMQSSYKCPSLLLLEYPKGHPTPPKLNSQINLIDSEIPGAWLPCALQGMKPGIKQPDWFGVCAT